MTGIDRITTRSWRSWESLAIPGDLQTPSIRMSLVWRSTFSGVALFFVQANTARVTWSERAARERPRAPAITLDSAAFAVRPQERKREVDMFLSSGIGC